MPRAARLVVPHAPHHVIQRGHNRQRVFFSPADYRAYRAIAVEEFASAGVEVWAYCLMPNHVHLIAAPPEGECLAKAVGRTHLRYTRQINARKEATGHLWQGRFASFPMHEDYLQRCLRYVGFNPVRAGLVQRATDWPWSSVQAHAWGIRDTLLTTEPIVRRYASDLAELFEIDVESRDVQLVRNAISTSRPLGAEDWVMGLTQD